MKNKDWFSKGKTDKHKNIGQKGFKNIPYGSRNKDKEQGGSCSAAAMSSLKIILKGYTETLL